MRGDPGGRRPRHSLRVQLRRPRSVRPRLARLRVRDPFIDNGDGSCGCNFGNAIDGGECVCPKDENGACTCTAPYAEVNSVCGCEVPYVDDGYGNCVVQCQAPFAADGNGGCACQSSYVEDGTGSCVCPGASMDDGAGGCMCVDNATDSGTAAGASATTRWCSRRACAGVLTAPRQTTAVLVVSLWREGRCRAALCLCCKAIQRLADVPIIAYKGLVSQVPACPLFTPQAPSGTWRPKTGPGPGPAMSPAMGNR